MKTILYPLKETWDDLCKRPVMNTSNLDSAVRNILDRVKREGDKALSKYTLEFDMVSLSDFKVSDSEIDQSISSVSADLKKAIRIAGRNIEKFHRSQLIKEQAVETMPGIKCWRKNIPIENVGLYIPGGTAPLFSTVLMLAIPAKIAGCNRIVLCTPPDRNGKINPLILYTASLTGITEIFKIGGAQAIAAMAFGTETVPMVSKIFGPGNQYVTKAKEIVNSRGVATDMPAGPSEVLIIADSTADPVFIAADLLSQAEHGSDSQVVLLTDSKGLLVRVLRELKAQIQALPRKKIAVQALKKSFSVLFNDLQECIEFSNRYAPEHLIINVSRTDYLVKKVVNAGSVFIGRYSCESAGDYASGTNHTLPTNGFARSYSGVSTDSFLRKITFQKISGKGIKNIGSAIELMAEAEDLYGHKNAVSVRLKTTKNV